MPYFLLFIFFPRPQAELLKRLRTADDAEEAGGNPDALKDREILQDALLITINGIANGLRSSG
jgi:phosphoenolpyruvate carboxylase